MAKGLQGPSEHLGAEDRLPSQPYIPYGVTSSGAWAPSPAPADHLLGKSPPSSQVLSEPLS